MKKNSDTKKIDNELEEIRIRAAEFSRRWKGPRKEQEEAQIFIDEFFAVFGLEREKVAKLKSESGKTQKRMDGFWKGKLLIEIRAFGEDLDTAVEQTLQRYHFKPDEVDEPRWVLACDFHDWLLLDQNTNARYEFMLDEFSEKIGLFGFMTDRPVDTDSVPANEEAAKKMSKIYDQLKNDSPDTNPGYFLTRLAFCLFADNMGVFRNKDFYRYIVEKTMSDGSDLGMHLKEIFATLNKDTKSRSKDLDANLSVFPYINGALFSQEIDAPHFSKDMRDLLIEAAEYDWSKVSPNVFGSMFEVVIDDGKRQAMGAHYTSEEDIMKVIRPLFLDGLLEDYRAVLETKDDTRRASLGQFQDRLASLKFLDPACGSGSFLLIAYRELRKLEQKCILEMHRMEPFGKNTDVSKVNVDQFYGIELTEFSASIAEVSLWVMDHLMNMKLSEKYGVPYRRIPLTKKPTIARANALVIDWNEVLPAEECHHVLGKPPFGAYEVITQEQKKYHKKVLKDIENSEFLDYVACWFLKASEYVQNGTGIGFVATNTLSEGEQGGIMEFMLPSQGLLINFAYKPFKWGSKSNDSTTGYVIILGYLKDIVDDMETEPISFEQPRLFSVYKGRLIKKWYSYISHFLIGGDEPLGVVVRSDKPLNNLPPLKRGSDPVDGGHYIFTKKQRDEFLKKEPGAHPYMKKYISADGFLDNEHKYILLLEGIKPSEQKKLPMVQERIGMVKTFRKNSSKKITRDLAKKPLDCGLDILEKPSLLIPYVTSEGQDYVPIAYVQAPIIPGDATFYVSEANLEIFGLLISKMHMCWLNHMGGGLKIKSRYSSELVYNIFPVPDKHSGLGKLAQDILDIRAEYPKSTLRQLYSSKTMPAKLRDAHLRLDEAVDKLYGKKTFKSDLERTTFLLEAYAEMFLRTRSEHSIRSDFSVGIGRTSADELVPGTGTGGSGTGDDTGTEPAWK